MKEIEQTDNEQIAHQVVINEQPRLHGEIVIIHLPNGIRAELPASLTLIQIQTWLRHYNDPKGSYLSRCWYY
ncbi:hypothetical protein [Photobacterium kishitanii]|uniref:hypothetical protein n=1 Tax=Photobacterium kishitanii TaxID=318456 RepID=UPI001F22DC9B|nr:hypothetical protein [Photobacterium kishitanii]